VVGAADVQQEEQGDDDDGRNVLHGSGVPQQES
jgi:hypothetical protein